MAWTYDFALFNSVTPSPVYPPTTLGQRYQVRLMIQDTNTNRQLFQDEEIDYTVTLFPNAATAAAALCDTLVAKGGSIASKKVGELSISYDPKFYRLLAAELRARGAGYQVPYAGGISASDKQAQQQQTDWVQPAINRGQGNDPYAPSPSDPPIVTGGSSGGTNGGF